MGETGASKAQAGDSLGAWGQRGAGLDASPVPPGGAEQAEAAFWGSRKARGQTSRPMGDTRGLP